MSPSCFALLTAHQRSSDQMKIFKDQSVQTTTTTTTISLVATLLNQQSAQLKYICLCLIVNITIASVIHFFFLVTLS